LLVAHQVIEDDSEVIGNTMRWDLTIPAGRVVIVIKSAMADAPAD